MSTSTQSSSRRILVITIQIILFLLFTGINFAQENIPAYKNTSLTIETRVIDLISRMTLKEKISQMSHLAPAIKRLGIKTYEPNFNNPFLKDSNDLEIKDLKELKKNRPWENYEYWHKGNCLDGGWWNEALHGLARSGLATSFPQSIGLGSTWDPDIIRKMADVISTEARIHNNVYGKKLTYWSPTINILRDPRWGRAEESYSEDPYLLSSMAVAFVKGFQGSDPHYLKAIATVKHFVANNSEFNRHTGSSDISERWLREYYFPAFKSAITIGGVFSVMGAYNSINGVPVCANKWLLTDILRNEWGFKGYVVSDCGAISDIVHKHKYEIDPLKAVASAVKAGTDLECETCETEQFMYDKYLYDAVKKGYISEKYIDKSVTRLFTARFLLGEFDPADKVPFTKIPRAKLDCEEHRNLALLVAKESIVLLKNQNNTLPLNKDSIKKLAVIGPNANVVELGGYSGSPAVHISPLEGLQNKLNGKAEVAFKQGCSILGKEENGWDKEKDKPIYKNLDETQSIIDAARLAANSDAAILFVGTNLSIANESADRTNLDLPGNQLELIKKVYEANPNTIVVLINGMPLSINWVDENIPAIIEAWYDGQAGGEAIADALFGDFNPGGKLPITFYKSANDLPPIDDYDITKGRTYWFFKGNVLYPFGYGLSYTTFEYTNISVNKSIIDKNRKNEVIVSVNIKNTGKLKGDEVVQLYIKELQPSIIQPEKRLKKFKRITLNPGETKTVTFKLNDDDFSYWDEMKKVWDIEVGNYEIQIGSSSKDIRLNTIIKAI
jgi:beta-glucosidase